jgi:PAS domain S-box-containing protein
MTDDNRLHDAADWDEMPSVLESRDHLEAILQGVADGVVVHDQHGRIAYANAAASGLFGQPPEVSLLGRSIDDLLAPFDLFDVNRAPISAGDLPAWEVFGGSAAARRTIIRRQRETSEERWWLVNASPVRDSAGQVPFVVSILRDATDRVMVIQANARLAALVASSADAIVGMTLDAIITTWNPAAEALYGYTSDEAVGTPVSILVPPDRQDELPAIMERLRSGESVNALETERVAKSGARLDVSLTISPILAPDGSISGASMIARDISEQRRAENALRLLAEIGRVLGTSLNDEEMLGSVAEVVVPGLADWCSISMIDDTGRLNQLALHHREPAKVRHILEIQQRMPYDDDPNSGIVAAMRRREPIVHREIDDAMLLEAARSPEHLEVLRELAIRSSVIVPIVIRGQAVGAITFAYAESGRNYHDDEIELAMEIARRVAIAIDNAWLLAEAQEAAQARQDFLLTASHELRTPLTSVKAAGQLVARYLQQPNPNRQRIETMILNLQSEIGRLEAISVDLLDAARIQRGQFELERAATDLVEIASDVIASLERSSVRLPSHELVLDAGEPIVGYWDARRLRQLVSNLVSNALKYSPNGGIVRVQLTSRDGVGVMAVEDHGIGIKPTEAANLFRPFERAATVRQSVGGVGLGLYITKQIVDAHGGSITVESSPGEGSRFIVRLPREEPSRPSAAST